MPFMVYQALAADPLLAGVRQVWGSHYLEEQASPPRIVWVPGEEENEGPEVGDYPVPIWQEITAAQPVTIRGADANGAVRYLSAVPGVRVAHEFLGAGTALDVVVDGLDVSVRLGVSAAGIVTSTASAVAAKVAGTPAAAALLTAYPQGTGAGLAKASPRAKLRSIATRVAEVKLHLYAVDQLAMCKRPGGLINTVRYALWYAARGSLRIGTAQWADEPVSQKGVGYILPVSFLLPVLEELPAAQIQTVATTPPAEVIS